MSGFVISRVFSYLPYLIFAVILTIAAVLLFRTLRQRQSDRRAPRLTVDAKVAAKRMNVRSTGGGADGMAAGHCTSYYATFEVESGDRMELRLNGQDYGMLVEGDRGKLSFQGSQFLNFTRN